MITAQHESFEACLEEMKPLLPLHWEELALFRDKMPLDPDYAYFVRQERAGQLQFVTLRQAGELLGYYVGMIGPSPHYKSTLTAKMDVIYLVPEHRGAGAGGMLMAEIRRGLKQRGVKLWWMGSKNHKPIEALFRAFGFTDEESYFALWIGDDDA